MTNDGKIKWALTSSLRITSTWRRLLNSSHSSLYRSISSFIWRIFFLSTSKREPCVMLVLIFFCCFESKIDFTLKRGKIDNTAPRHWINWAEPAGCKMAARLRATATCRVRFPTKRARYFKRGAAIQFEINCVYKLKINAIAKGKMLLQRKNAITKKKCDYKGKMRLQRKNYYLQWLK